VIIAVVTVYDQVKKKGASQKDEQRQPRHTPRPAPFNMPGTNVTTVPLRSETHPAARQPETAKKVPAMAHSYKPLTNIPDDDDSILRVENLDADNEISPKSNMSAKEMNDRQAHYDRWRRAVIDMQILERKF